MKNPKAFTLVELLVVISIIALLLAILIPSLNKARELANRIVCGTRLKNFATASYSYTFTSDGYFVPFCHVGWNRPALLLGNYDYDQGDRLWFQNEAFRSYLSIDSYQDYDNLWAMPKKFLCPSDKVSKNRQNNEARHSFAYNNSDWRPWTIAYKIVGYKASVVKRPSETLNFIDSITYDVDFNGGHYVGGWDRIKNILPSTRNWPAPCDSDLGTAFYRHSEGANIGFYDGHAEWRRKQDAFDWYGYHETPARTGIWTASGRMIPGWFVRFAAFAPP